MIKFLRLLKLDVPVIIKAYPSGNIEVLKEHCSPQLVERLSGIIAAQTASVSACVCL